MIGTLIIISMSTPLFVLVALPLLIIYCFMQVEDFLVLVSASHHQVSAFVRWAFVVPFQRFYVATSRQLKRIESINLSPIYSHFDESIQGVATIRAFDKQEMFKQESLARVDRHQQAYYPNIVCNRLGLSAVTLRC